MSTPTLPLCAALYCGDGRPWYPVRPTVPTHPDATDVLWLPKPEIPDRMPFRWARLDEVSSAGLDLADATTLAELAYTSSLDPRVPVDDDRLCRAVLEQAAACGCDLAPVISRLAQDAGDRPQACADRMAWCLGLVARLLPGAA